MSSRQEPAMIETPAHSLVLVRQVGKPVGRRFSAFAKCRECGDGGWFEFEAHRGNTKLVNSLDMFDRLHRDIHGLDDFAFVQYEPVRRLVEYPERDVYWFIEVEQRVVVSRVLAPVSREVEASIVDE